MSGYNLVYSQFQTREVRCTVYVSLGVYVQPSPRAHLATIGFFFVLICGLICLESENTFASNALGMDVQASHLS